MRLDLQPKLLRAIQEQEIERVGGHQLLKVDVRIVATTNRDLLAEIRANRFRRDLYYRLSVMPIRTPPLRERLGDVPLLTEYFVRNAAAALGVKPPEVPPETLELLQRRSWQGNIRELANVIERAVILCRGGQLLPAAVREVQGVGAAAEVLAPARGAPDGAPINLKELEHIAIERALVATGGHRTRAAELLGISERTLRNKLRPGAKAVEE